MDIYKFTIPEIIFGRGCLEYAGICAKQLGASRIFVVSDHGVENAGWVKRLLDILEKENLDYVYYCDVTPNPKDFQIHNGAELYKDAKSDVILALGGGSPMDAAKGIALLVSNGGDIQDYEGEHYSFVKDQNFGCVQGRIQVILSSKKGGWTNGSAIGYSQTKDWRCRA